MKWVSFCLILVLVLPGCNGKTSAQLPPISAEEATRAFSDAGAIENLMVNGGEAGVASFPLPPEAGEREASALAAYPPFQRAVATLQDLGSEEQAAFIDTLLWNAGGDYLKLYGAAKVEGHIRAGGQHMGGNIMSPKPFEGIIAEPDAEGLKSARWRMLAASALIAACELDAMKAAQKGNTNMGLIHRNECATLPAIPGLRDEAMTLLAESSVYVRPIMGTAILACVKSRAERKALVHRLGFKTTDPRYGGSGEKQLLPICEDMTDDQYDALVEAVFPGLLAQAAGPTRIPAR
jgi:hypothetical protein